MSEVQWRKIPGLNERHEVSACGRVRTTSFVNAKGRAVPAKEKKITVSQVGPNYRTSMVRVSDGGVEKVHLVHRLIAAAFIGPCPSGHEVLHRDGNSLNNAVSNLRYGTRKENVADTYLHGRGIKGETHPMAKLSDAQVQEIRLRAQRGERGVHLARAFGVSSACISSIKSGTRRAYI
jgi:hypothetical protein